MRHLSSNVRCRSQCCPTTRALPAGSSDTACPACKIVLQNSTSAPRATAAWTPSASSPKHQSSSRVGEGSATGVTTGTPAARSAHTMSADESAYPVGFCGRGHRDGGSGAR
jgi:hypothetical protein